MSPAARDDSPLQLLTLGAGDAFAAMRFNTCVLLLLADDDAPGGRRRVLLDCPAPIHRLAHRAQHASGIDCSLHLVRDLIITHLHGDHAAGLEMFGFAARAHRAQHPADPTPRLFTHAAVADRVWERLAPAMDVNVFDPNARLTLDDYYNVRTIDDATPTPIIQGLNCRGTPAELTIETRPTNHPIPTRALRIRYADRTLGWSSDTTFDADLLDWLAPADLIVHEAGGPPLHTEPQRLAELPAPLLAKLRVNHLRDDFDQAGTGLTPLIEGDVTDV